MTDMNDADMDFQMAELNRRIANLIKIGVIEEVDYSQTIPRAKVRLGDLLTTWLPMLTVRAGKDRSWWPLEVGEQVIVLSPSGDPAQGIILGSLNQTAFPANGDSPDIHRIDYDDGAVIEYNRATHALKAELPDGATTELRSNGGIQFIGDLTVNGNIKATKDVSDKQRSMAGDRLLYNQHEHPGITPGSGTTLKTTTQQ